MQFLLDINQIGYYAIYTLLFESSEHDVLLKIWILNVKPILITAVISSFNSPRLGAYLTKELMTQVVASK